MWAGQSLEISPRWLSALPFCFKTTLKRFHFNNDHMSNTCLYADTFLLFCVYITDLTQPQDVIQLGVHDLPSNGNLTTNFTRDNLCKVLRLDNRAATIDRKWITNYLNNWFIVSVSLKQKSKKNFWFWVSNVRICCFSLSFIKLNEESLCFGLLFGQEKSF